MTAREIYISTDIEADGPVPGPNSMLSLASAAFTASKELLGTFSVNLETLPDARPDPGTTQWWATQPEAWAACRADPQPPALAMQRYADWVRSLPGKPVFVGYPASYDFLFVYWYLMRFVGDSPFGFAALDIRTYAMAALKQDFTACRKASMPAHWFDAHPHTHIALDDAIEQGHLFCNMLADHRRESTPATRARLLLQHLECIIRSDDHLMQLLRVARSANLPQWRVVAGCIYQTAWNALTGRPPGTGLNDYDLIYFDNIDLSQEAEAATQARIRSQLPSLPLPLEVCNQARVHLWFGDFFGIPYPPLSSADEALTRYASATHAVGVRLGPDDRLDIFAPFGLDDIFDMIIRPNHVLPNQATHEKKAARAKAIWPELTVIPWSGASLD